MPRHQRGRERRFKHVQGYREAPELTQADARLQLAFQTPAERRTDEQWALLGEQPKRAPPVQRESAEMQEIMQQARTRWWRWGLIRHEPAVAIRMDERTKQRRKAEGIRGGMPDLELVIPWMARDFAVHAYLELKEPESRPKRAVAERWWLEWHGTGEQTHYGLTARQAAMLQCYAAAGCPTMVAFSADEALAWLDAQAGSPPDVLPREWRYWLEPEL